MGLLDWVKNREASRSNARKTEERASRAAQSMSERWDNENARAFLDFKNKAIRELERKDAKQPQVDRREPGREESQKPSRTQPKYADLFDRVPNTEAGLKRAEALFDMTLVVQHIARDPDPNVGKYKGDFERAVSGMRETCGFEVRDQHAEKTQTDSMTRDAGMQHERASSQQPGRGRNWER